MTTSRICLGCYSFGGGAEWMLDDEDSAEIIEHAIDRGITFFDTANAYSTGNSERILGDVLDGYDTDRMVVGTKVCFQMDEDNPNSGGLSRKALEQEVAASRDRLGMDTVDLLSIHRWDYDTPVEETLRTLDDMVRRNEVRYVGGSSMWARQFAEALYKADALGLERFATMQNHYNLAYREEEREMLPLCEKEDIGVTPWSPLARGYLARPHEEMTTTTRGETDEHVDNRVEVYEHGAVREINERVEEVAADKGVTMAQVSLAWLLHKDWVDAPIVGTTSVEHVDDAIEALEVSLSSSDVEYLEEPYVPVPITGHE